jgi:predicted P-loop ATPase
MTSDPRDHDDPRPTRDGATGGAGGDLSGVHVDTTGLGPGRNDGEAGDNAARGTGDKPLTRAQKFAQEQDAKVAAVNKRQVASDPQPASINRNDTDVNTCTVRVTFFNDEYATTFSTQELPLPALRDLILKAKGKTKADLPWVKLARFGDKRKPKEDGTPGNCLRWDDNVTAIDGVESDYDKERMSFEEAVAALKDMNVRGIVYTTPTHTEAKPRWRYLLPLSRKYPPEMRAKFLARVNGKLDKIFANESFTLSQSYYFGRAEDNTAADHKAVVVDGDFIDLRDDLYRFQEKGFPENRVAADDKTGPPRGFEARMALLGDGPGLEGFNKVLIPAIGAYAATYGPGMDKEVLKETVRAAIDAAPKGPYRTDKQISRCKSDKHLDRLIEGAIAKYGKNVHLGFDIADNNLPVNNSQKNIWIALAHLKIEVSHDAFQNRSIIKGLEQFDLLNDAAMDRVWLTIDEKYRFRPSKDFFWTVVENEARLNSFHPVCDYLNGLTWDGTKRIDSWLINYAGADDTEYVRAVSPLPLIAAVRRVRKPGCKFDEMLTLISDQGLDKSTGLIVLAVNPDWFSDDLPLNIDSKKTIERLHGRWIIEAAELKGMRHGDIEHLKSFLSRRVDRARLSYDRAVTELLRQCVIIGTTNHEKFLRDQTGNRRFWPVRIVAFKIDKLKKDVDQIWAEAAAREAAGDSIRLDRKFWDGAAEEQTTHTLEEPWVEIIQELLSDKEIKNGKLLSADGWKLVGIPEAQRTQESNGRLGTAMRLCGWERRKLRFAGIGPHWGYVRVGNEIKFLKRIMVDYDWRSRETSVRLSEPDDDDSEGESTTTKNTEAPKSTSKSSGSDDDLPF